jgi:hypothetical protein
MLVIFNHKYEKSLTLSNIWCEEFAEFLNNIWFFSFHTTQTHVSHISCKKDRRARRPRAEKVNWMKWSCRFWGSTAEKPIQDLTNAQREPKVLQERNKCCTDSTPPHPDTQSWASGRIMPRLTKFVFVGNLTLTIEYTTFKNMYIFYFFN